MYKLVNTKNRRAYKFTMRTYLYFIMDLHNKIIILRLKGNSLSLDLEIERWGLVITWMVRVSRYFYIFDT